MIVVGDSSPFVVLVKIGCVGILPALFKEILIPTQVARELDSPKRSDDVRTFIASSPPWLRIVAPKSTQIIPGLDAGESAAIMLAEEVRAGLLIRDGFLSGRRATHFPKGNHLWGKASEHGSSRSLM